MHFLSVFLHSMKFLTSYVLCILSRPPFILFVQLFLKLISSFVYVLIDWLTGIEQFTLVHSAFKAAFKLTASNIQFIKRLLQIVPCFLYISLYIPNKEITTKYDAFLYLIAL